MARPNVEIIKKYGDLQNVSLVIVSPLTIPKNYNVIPAINVSLYNKDVQLLEYQVHNLIL